MPADRAAWVVLRRTRARRPTCDPRRRWAPNSPLPREGTCRAGCDSPVRPVVSRGRRDASAETVSMGEALSGSVGSRLPTSQLMHPSSSPCRHRRRGFRGQRANAPSWGSGPSRVTQQHSSLVEWRLFERETSPRVSREEIVSGAQERLAGRPGWQPDGMIGKTGGRAQRASAALVTPSTRRSLLQRKDYALGGFSDERLAHLGRHLLQHAAAVVRECLDEKYAGTREIFEVNGTHRFPRKRRHLQIHRRLSGPLPGWQRQTACHTNTRHEGGEYIFER